MSQPLDLVDDGIEPEPRDELHGVVVEAVLLADAEDGDDVGVVQLGGCACLALEPFYLRRIGDRVSGEHFERDTPAEGLLLGFVDHAHAAAAGLAEDPEVAQRAPTSHRERLRKPRRNCRWDRRSWASSH